MADETEKADSPSAAGLVLGALSNLKDFEFDFEDLRERAADATERFVESSENLTKSEALAARLATRIDDLKDELAVH
jgi:proteasome assembly chaperone (PAC2) family protein